MSNNRVDEHDLPRRHCRITEKNWNFIPEVPKLSANKIEHQKMKKECERDGLQISYKRTRWNSQDWEILLPRASTSQTATTCRDCKHFARVGRAVVMMWNTRSMLRHHSIVPIDVKCMIICLANCFCRSDLDTYGGSDPAIRASRETFVFNFFQFNYFQ